MTPPNPNGFSDNDLKLLKEDMDRLGDFNVGNYRLRPLLTRLEAAEDCIDDHRGDCLSDCGGKCSCGYAEKLETWQRSKWGGLNGR